MSSLDPASLAALADCGKTPIAPDAPAGADASYDPDYEAVQREIDKLSVATAAGSSPDWDLVVRLAADLLRTRSKDLKIAAYLAEALTRTARIEGLAAGTRILRDLVETYWEELHPPKKRLRGRLGALDWWQERAKAALEAYADAPLPATLVAGLGADLAALDAALADRAPEAAPLAPLIEAASRLPVEAESPEPQAGPAPPPPDPTPAPPTPPQAVPDAPAAPVRPDRPAPPPTPAPAAGSVEQARERFTAGLDTLFGAAFALWQADPASPVPYRLVRLSAWLPLTAPPPATGGKTMLPAPPAQIRAALGQALSPDNALAVIGGAESRVRECRFWLDLSRISADGLRLLGPAYAAALDALETETALLLRRLPQLAGLCFADGSPFADDKTRLWLSRLGQRADADRPDRTADAADVASDAAVRDQARDLVAANQTAAAAGLLAQRLRTAPGGRLRLRWRLALVDLLLGAGQTETARPLIEQILEALARHDLERFDPPLAVAALVTARQGLAAAADPAAKARAREILDRIARLDPAQALRIAGMA